MRQRTIFSVNLPVKLILAWPADAFGDALCNPEALVLHSKRYTLQLHIYFLDDHAYVDCSGGCPVSRLYQRRSPVCDSLPARECFKAFHRSDCRAPNVQQLRARQSKAGKQI